MKEKAPNNESTSRAAAHVNKSLSRGISFPAPSHLPPAQLVGEAKAPITQPDPADQSADVPDLPKDLVQKLSDAKLDATKRENALDDLFTYLKAQGVVEQPPGYSGPPINVEMVYKPTKGGGKPAYTQYVSSGTKAEVAIHVFASIFDGTIASLYSTLRHELIHGAQQTQEPDDKADASDEYIFGITDPTLTEKLVQPLQEIETHVWEIIHARETGIDKDATYLGETVKFLKVYTDKAVQYISGARTKVDDIKSFRGYINKAVGHLRSVAADVLADELKKACDDKIASVKKRKDPLGLSPGSGIKKNAKKK